MRDREELTRDNFVGVYKLEHAGGGWSGGGPKWIAVTEETETELIGLKYSPTRTWPVERAVYRKDNLAGWAEDRAMFTRIPASVDAVKQNEASTPDIPLEELKTKYVDGEIDETEFEDRLEDYEPDDLAAAYAGVVQDHKLTRGTSTGRKTSLLARIPVLGAVLG